MKAFTKISLAMASGLMMAAAWPTRGFTPLIFIAFIPLLYLQDISGDPDDKKKGNIFLLSFLAFFIWNTLTTYWVWNSTAAGAIAMLILNSTFMATVFWAYHFVKKKLYGNKKGYFMLPVFFVAFEYLHLNWQLNWPWLNISNVFSHQHTWIQWYEYTGSAGGTIWVLASNIIIYKLFKAAFIDKTDKKSIIKKGMAAILVIAIPIITSLIIYNNYKEEGEDIEVVVIQPNIDPYTEEFTLSPLQIMERNIPLADSIVTEKTLFVLSPESAIQEALWIHAPGNSISVKKLKAFDERHPECAYIIGASTFSIVPAGMEDDFAARAVYLNQKEKSYIYAHNTALMVTKDTIDHYHKSKLTPGVEQMPSWWFLRPLERLAIDLGGTSGTLKGEDNAHVFEHNGIKAAALICYESAFGNYVIDFVKEGADILFVITNDGWWGNTPGHRQHLELSKLRAIETRRSIARSANTGISAYINQRGDIIEKTQYEEPAALRNTLKSNDKQTFYVRYGNYLYTASVFITIIMLSVCLVFIVTRKK